MAKSKILYGIGFALVMCVIGLAVGTYIGGQCCVPEGSGLAGPAIALGYGVIGIVVALVLAVVLARVLSYEKLRLALLLVGIPFLLLIAVGIYRFIQLQRAQEAEMATEQARMSTKVAPSADIPVAEEVSAFGVGIVFPALDTTRALYFYNRPDPQQPPHQLSPVDSLTFKQGPYSIDLVTAPPRFEPEMMKLDYDLLSMRAATLHGNWIEVVVNQTTGETRWIDRNAVRYEPWEQFLLGVVAVEPIDSENNPVRINPVTHAEPILDMPDAVLRPLAVHGTWLQVALSEEVGVETVRTGWIQWRDNTRLLITYSMLS